MTAPDLPMRERIAEAHRRASEAHQWRGTRVYPYFEVTCWCWAKFDTRAEWLEHQQLMAADAVLAVLADPPDTAVEAGGRALTEPEPIPGAKTLGCARHHRVIFNNGCPACNKEARAVLTAAIKEGKA